MTMTLEKTRSEFEGIEEVESCKSERPQGYYVSWGKMNWSTIDANGNLVNDGQKIYTWDAVNRLVGVSIIGLVPTTQANNVQMSYDGKGRRISIVENHGSTILTGNTFVWCDNNICQDRDVNGHIVTKQFYGQGEQINGDTYFWTFDKLGSVREMTDSSGVIGVQYDYDPWGRTIKLKGSLDSDFGYTTIYVNRTTGFYFAEYRILDSEKGRWLNRDPVGENAGINIYEYVKDNPYKFTDRIGLDATPGNGGGVGPGGPAGYGNWTLYSSAEICLGTLFWNAYTASFVKSGEATPKCPAGGSGNDGGSYVPPDDGSTVKVSADCGCVHSCVYKNNRTGQRVIKSGVTLYALGDSLQSFCQANTPQ